MGGTTPEMALLLLPGMDGSGTLFGPFLRLLPEGFDVRVVRYPEDTYLTYEQLAARVLGCIPTKKAYVIIAESYSGPVATLLAAHPVGNLRAVVLVSSFVSLPLGRIGPWIASFVPAALFRWRVPAWILRWFLMESSTPRDMVSMVHGAIARVKPEVLARRFHEALNAGFAAALTASTVRIVCLLSGADRLLGTRGLRGCRAAKPDVEVVRIAGPHLLLQCAPDSSLAALRKLGLLARIQTGNRSSLDSTTRSST
jgi:pimeloyl-ACP methyl ester carboxylesterase